MVTCMLDVVVEFSFETFQSSLLRLQSQSFPTMFLCHEINGNTACPVVDLADIDGYDNRIVILIV